MLKIILFNLLISFSIFMIFISNPLSMGLFILIQTTIISMILGMFLKTYWFSYILFITFLGGLLVLFIYISSVASNELFKPSINFIIFFIIFFILSFVMSFILKNNFNLMNFFFNNEMMNFFEIFFFNNDNKINLNKMYNSQTYLLMTMIIIYLFITLIAIVKITNIFFGALRSSS